MASNKLLFPLLMAKVKFEINVYYGKLSIPQIAIDTNNILKTSPVLIDGDKIFKTGFSAYWHICEKYHPELLIENTEYLDWAIWSEQLYGPLSSLHNMHVYGHQIRSFGRFKSRLETLNTLLENKEYLINDKLSMIDLMIFSFFWQIKESEQYEKIWNFDEPLREFENQIITLNQCTNIDIWYSKISKNFQREIDIIKNKMPWAHEGFVDKFPMDVKVVKHKDSHEDDMRNERFTLEIGPEL